ncbi:MAG: hypothetical protein ACFB9N_16325 [Geitlerinemataceae cyanobacterium]
MNAERRSLYLYLIPVFGFFPAWWTLYRYRRSSTLDTERRDASRLSVTLGLVWLAGHLLAEFGAGQSQSGLPLLIASSLWTTGYIAIEFGLMVRVWQRKSLRVPGLSAIGRKLP